MTEAKQTESGGGQSVVILGATSAMAIEVARLYAGEKARLTFVGRDGARMQAVAQDCAVRGASHTQIITADLADLSTLGATAERILKEVPAIDVLLLAHGTLGDQLRAQSDGEHAEVIMRTNYVAPCLLLEPLAAAMQARGSGTIAGIGSVAGNRGRQSNYFYGSAKAGFAAYLSGLRNRLAASGVAVVTILPGFVATPMTAHLKPGPLVAAVAPVGAMIHRAIKSRRDVVYVPAMWRYIMWIIGSIPEFIFKRLNI